MLRLRTFIMMAFAVFALCAIGSASASAHEFLVNGNPITGTTSEPVLTEAGLALLEVGTKVVDCEKAHGLILVLAAGRTWVHDIHFLNCKTAQTGCAVHSIGAPNGLILLVNVPDLLVVRKQAGGTEVLADEFQENPTTKEFVTLKFLVEAGGSCSEYGAETKVKGQVAGEIENAAQLILFPNPELQGNTLEAFGKAARFLADFKNKLVNGGILKAD